jgi:hypothetical protein
LWLLAQAHHCCFAILVRILVSCWCKKSPTTISQLNPSRQYKAAWALDPC